MLWTNVGTKQAKIEKISIFPAIQLGFLRSLVRPIGCEANKSNLWHKERQIGDLWRKERQIGLGLQ